MIFTVICDRLGGRRVNSNSRFSFLIKRVIATYGFGNSLSKAASRAAASSSLGSAAIERHQEQAVIAVGSTGWDAASHLPASLCRHWPQGCSSSGASRIKHGKASATGGSSMALRHSPHLLAPYIVSARAFSPTHRTSVVRSLTLYISVGMADLHWIHSFRDNSEDKTAGIALIGLWGRWLWHQPAIASHIVRTAPPPGFYLMVTTVTLWTSAL